LEEQKGLGNSVEGGGGGARSKDQKKKGEKAGLRVMDQGGKTGITGKEKKSQYASPDAG